MKSEEKIKTSTQTILVTGGAGFIGTNFIRHTLSKHPDWRIVNLDAVTYAGNPANLADLAEKIPESYHFVHGDISDGQLVEQLFAEEQFDDDGSPDSGQDFVTSLLTYDDQEYVTLAVPDTVGLSDVEAIENPSPSDSPSDVEFTYEFFDFKITGLALGGSTTVTFYLPAGAAPTTYYKYGPTPADNTDHWYEFMFDSLTNTGAVINGNEITLHFVDGLRGDDDLDDTNGIIVDAGGPGFTSDSDDGDGGGGGGGGGGCFIATTSPGLSDITVVSMIPYLALMLLLFVIGKATQGRRKR